MRIENLLLNKYLLDNKEEFFKEGYSFKARVIEIIDDLILLDVKGHGTIEAKLDTDVKLFVNEEIPFQIKSMDEDAIVLKPMKENLPNIGLSKDYKESNPVSNLLKGLNIKETKLSVELAENLMKYNAPLTEKNLSEGIKSLEKILQLYNLNEDEKIVLISGDKIEEKNILINQDGKEPILKEQKISEIKRFINNEVKQEQVHTKVDTLEMDKANIIEKQNFESLDLKTTLEKADIKGLIIVNKEEYDEKPDLSELTKDLLGKHMDIDKEKEIIKIISFFQKNNIKSSLGNIRNFSKFNENPIEFVKELKEVDNILKKLEINKVSKDIFIEDKENSEKEIFSSKFDKLNEIQKNIKDIGERIEPSLKEEINSKIEFLKEMNKELSFMFYPLNHKEKELDGILTLIKENKKKNKKDDRTNIYINVETHNLGNIKVSCQLLSNILNIKINIKKEDMELFTATEDELVEKILSIGYSIEKIDFIVDDNIQIIDSVISNPNPVYFLDLKV